MEKMGNRRSNQWFESNLKDYEKPTPTSDRNARVLFINAKYKELSFIPPLSNFSLESVSSQEFSESLYDFCSKQKFVPTQKKTSIEIVDSYITRTKRVARKDSPNIFESEDDEDFEKSPKKNNRRLSKSVMLKMTSKMSRSNHQLPNYKILYPNESEKQNSSSSSSSQQDDPKIESTNKDEEKTENKDENNNSKEKLELESNEMNETFRVVSFLRFKADPNWQESVSLKTSLHQACINDKSEIFFALVQNGADLSKKDKTGSTPLHYIASDVTLVHCMDLIARCHGIVQKNLLTIKDDNEKDVVQLAQENNNTNFLNFCESINKKKKISIDFNTNNTTNGNKTEISTPSKQRKDKNVLFTSRRTKTVANKQTPISKRFEVDNNENENEKLSRDIAALDIHLNITSPILNSDEEIEKKSLVTSIWKKEN